MIDSSLSRIDILSGMQIFTIFIIVALFISTYLEVKAGEINQMQLVWIGFIFGLLVLSFVHFEFEKKSERDKLNSFLLHSKGAIK